MGVRPEGVHVELGAAVLELLGELYENLGRLLLKHGTVQEAEDLLLGVGYSGEHSSSV
jgi:hypothetical protein